jgi:hypothetical protein
MKIIEIIMFSISHVLLYIAGFILLVWVWPLKKQKNWKTFCVLSVHLMMMPRDPWMHSRCHHLLRLRWEHLHPLSHCACMLFICCHPVKCQLCCSRLILLGLLVSKWICPKWMLVKAVHSYFGRLIFQLKDLACPLLLGSDHRNAMKVVFHCS